VTSTGGRIEDRVGDLPPPEWESLAEGGPLAVSVPWLRSVASRAQGEGHWFLAFDDRDGDSTPVCGLFATLAGTAATDDAFNLHDVLFGAPRTMPLADDAIAAREQRREQSPARDEWFPNLVVTLPSAECLPVGPGAADPKTTEVLVDGIVDWARRNELAAVSFLYLRRTHTALTDTLASRAFTRLPLSFTGELHLPGTGFDDYLAALPKQRRRSVRKEMETVEDAGVTIRRRDVKECLDDLVELRLALKRKYGRTPNPDKERSSFHGLIDEFSPDELHLLTAEIGEQLLGFGLDIVYNGVWNGVVSGTNYDDPRSDSVSFCLDYYEPVRHAYERGVRTLAFGMAAWEAKRNRGCELVPLDGYVLALRDDLAPAVAAAPTAAVLRFT